MSDRIVTELIQEKEKKPFFWMNELTRKMKRSEIFNFVPDSQKCLTIGEKTGFCWRRGADLFYKMSVASAQTRVGSWREVKEEEEKKEWPS